MAVLLISYDLRGPERPSSWDDVRKAIEHNATAWIRPLYSEWLVETDHTLRQWSSMLESVIDGGDRLFICEVTSRYWGQLPKEFWEWLRVRIGAPTG